MSITSLERTTSTPSNGLGSGGAPPADTRRFATGDRLYRVIWRWHFYAGMIVAPALIVVAATGALYIFKDELEAVIYPGVTYVEPAP
ncbi:MAG TPA: PepSY domain-containing protein, partial [Planctomycetaceae bacterium]|nr:PepSY domain-containing protein [Planctomycetaceae bacterium]